MSSASPVSYTRECGDAKLFVERTLATSDDSRPLPNVAIIHRPGEQPGNPLTRPPLEVRKRLLVVDDELSVLKLVIRILATDNYEITSANSGVEAAKLVEAPDHPAVDLLVTDLMMPEMNGRELAAVIRNKFPNARVLYVTGFADTLFKGVQELGDGESFIEKPFGVDGLLEATRLLMFGHISDMPETHDKREDADEWSDERVRAKVVRLLRKMRMA